VARDLQSPQKLLSAKQTMKTNFILAQEAIGGVQPTTLIGFLVVGLIAGALAKFLMPGKDPGGCIITMIIGVVGSFIGGYLVSLMGVTQGGVPTKIAVATLGAIVFLLLYRFLFKRK